MIPNGDDYGAAFLCLVLVALIAWPLLAELRDGRRNRRR